MREPYGFPLDDHEVDPLCSVFDQFAPARMLRRSPGRFSSPIEASQCFKRVHHFPARREIGGSYFLLEFNCQRIAVIRLHHPWVFKLSIS
jgi:hypothetical protein